MKTIKHPLPSLSRVLRTILLCIVTLFSLRSLVHGAEATNSSQAKMLASQQLFCSAGYDHKSCLQHAAALKGVLLRYPNAQPGQWSWIIVRSEDWGPFLLRLHLDERSPAFTALEQRSTFLEEVLFVPHSARAPELERAFATPFPQLLAVAVTHELAHAICHEMDERAANRIAQELRAGRNADCSQARGLTPVQEFDLHRHSPSFRP